MFDQCCPPTKSHLCCPLTCAQQIAGTVQGRPGHQAKGRPCQTQGDHQASRSYSISHARNQDYYASMPVPTAFLGQRKLLGPLVGPLSCLLHNIGALQPKGVLLLLPSTSHDFCRANALRGARAVITWKNKLVRYTHCEGTEQERSSGWIDGECSNRMTLCSTRAPIHNSTST